MPLPADFFGILTHILIQSQLRDSSCHLDCGRASFYNDALLFVEARRPFKEREVNSEPLALRDIREAYFINQGGRLIAQISLAQFIPFDSKILLVFKTIAEEMAKARARWSTPQNSGVSAEVFAEGDHVALGIGHHHFSVEPWHGLDCSYSDCQKRLLSVSSTS